MGSPSTGTVLTLQSDVAAANPTRYGIVREWAEGTEWTERIGGDRGRAVLVLPVERNGAPNPDVANAAIMDVLRIDDVDANGNVTTAEYRVTQIEDGVASPVVAVTCAPIIIDLGRMQIRSVVGGLPSKRVTFTDLTATEILSTIVIPAANADLGYTITLGTVVPAGRYTYDGTNVTPLALLTWLEEQTKYEAWLERTNETTWTLHLATRGSAAPQPVAMVGDNVTALDRTIVDDANFANRIEPIGDALSGADRPTDCGQATWKVQSFAAQVATLADPAGGDGPIAVDDQFTGRQLAWVLDSLHWPSTPGSVTSIAVDWTHRVVWVANGTGTLYWQEIETGVVGTLAVSGATNIQSVVYVAANDRIYASCRNAAKVEIINASTKASVGNVAVTGNPSVITSVPAKSLIFVANDDGVTAITAINTTTNTSPGTLGGTQSYTHVTYHAGQDRLFAWRIGNQNYRWFNANTLASVGTNILTVVPQQICDDPAQTSLLVFANNGDYATVNPSTGAPSSATNRSAYSADTVVPLVGLTPRVGSTHYLVATYGATSQVSVLPFTGSALTGTIGDAATATHWAVEPSSATPLLYLRDQDAIRRLTLTTAPAPIDSAPILSCSAAAQTVTLPAAGSGGPSVLPSTTRVQIREDSALAYCTRLPDPASIATYGPIDASPSYKLLGISNYWRGGTFDEFRSDDTSRWVSGRAYRWRAADQTALNGVAITLAANYSVNDPTASLSGLGAGRVLQPGDVIHNLASPGASSAVLMVLQRAVADGSGAAVVPVVPLAANITAGAMRLTTPALDLPAQQSNCLALMSGWSDISMHVPMPRLQNDAVAWVVAHVRMHCLPMIPHDVFMTVAAPFGPTLTAVRQADTLQVFDQLRDYWLVQRIDLINSHGVARVRLGIDGTSRGVVYLQSLAVITAPVSNIEAALDLYGSAGANSLVQVGNARMLSGRSPSVNYRVQVIETNPAKPFTLGATTILRDPARSVNATPRIVSVTRRPALPGQTVPRPEIELSSLPTSLAQAVAALERGR